MIIFGRLVKTHFKKTIPSTVRACFADGKQEGKDKPQDALVQREEKVNLMEDTFEQVKMKGLQDRSITGIDNFQREILTQNKFDLLNPKIQPKIASLSTTIGLQITHNNYLAEISLGKIKVKKENEVFLSEVDPYNIPEYYNIVFDYEKEMSLVGKKVEGTEGKEAPQEGVVEMNISTKKAFQQKSQQQLMDQVFGARLNYILNSRIVWKQYLLSLVITYFLTSPFSEVMADYFTCMQSITEIEEQRMKHIRNLRRESMINAIIDNPDMSIQ